MWKMQSQAIETSPADSLARTSLLFAAHDHTVAGSDMILPLHILRTELWSLNRLARFDSRSAQRLKSGRGETKSHCSRREVFDRFEFVQEFTSSRGQHILNGRSARKTTKANTARTASATVQCHVPVPSAVRSKRSAFDRTFIRISGSRSRISF